MSYPSGKKRVLFVDHTASLGGGEIALLNLVTNLSETRYEPVVLLFSNGPLVERLAEARIETHIISLDSNVINAKKDSLGIGTLMRGRQVLQAIAFTWKLRKFMRSNRIDLVHTNSLKADLLGGFAAKIARKPLIWHIRDRIDDDYLPGMVVRVFRWLCTFVPDFVIANSAATLSTVPGRAERRTSVGSGIDLRSRIVHDGMNQLESRQVNGRDQRSGIIGLVGRISRWKGQHVFLEAAARVNRQFPGVKFQIVGGPLFDEREYEKEIHAMTERLGLTECVEFTGFRNDVPDIISHMEVLVHASITAEPFGQVVTEGMLAGKPVVATAGGGVLEIVVDGVTGLLVPMGDAVAMGDAICQLLANSGAARRMGAAGRQRVLQNFTIEQTVARIECVYDEVLMVPRMMSAPVSSVRRLRNSNIASATIPFVVVAVAFLACDALHSRFGGNAPTSSLFLLAVALSTRLYGVTAGLVATLASIMAVAYILPPHNALAVDTTQLPVLILFATVSLILSPLIGNLKKAEVRARAAQAAAENARADADFIARASAAFAICTSSSAIVQAVTHLANTALGDWCVVDLLNEDGILVRAGAAHKDASHFERTKRLCALGPPTDADDPVNRAIQARRMGRFEPIARDSTAQPKIDRLQLYDQLGSEHGLVVPLNAGGQTLGAISLFRSDPDSPFRSADANLACEFATRAAMALASLEREPIGGRLRATIDSSLSTPSSTTGSDRPSNRPA